jgi:hypothetical protein
MNKTLSSIFRRTASLFLTGAAAVAFQGIVVQTASAHSLTVTATAGCQSGAAVISYTAISWDQTDIKGTNTEIDILFNGTKVDAQPFTLATTPPNQFSGQKPAPAGATSVDVEGVAVGTWGDLFPNGQTSTFTVAVPTNCAPPPGEGCTPGFWKNNANKNGGNLWIGFTPSELLSTAGFAVPTTFSDGSTIADATLLAALSFQGGSTLDGAAEILLRAAVAAILNADQFGGSASGIISAVNKALASNDRDTIINLANLLSAANNQACPLSNN